MAGSVAKARGTDHGDSASFGFREVALDEKQGLVDERLRAGRRPLRPDERPDVRRAAPALEGRAGRPARPRRGSRAGPIACSTWPAAPATSPSGSPSRSRRRIVTVADINGEMLAVGRERAAGAPSRPGRELRRGECRGPAVRRRALRRRDDRLRHPQRAADRRRRWREAYRVLKPRRPLPLPRILGGRRRRPRPALRPLLLQRHPARSARSSPATPSPTAIWSSRSAASRTRRASRAMIEAAGFERVEVDNLSGGIAAIHSGWKL